MVLVADLPDRFADLNVSSSDVSQYLQRLSTMGISKLSMFSFIYF